MTIALFTGVFGFVFVFILIVIVVIFVRRLMQMGRNNASPIVPVAARVVTKRENVNSYNHSTGDGMSHMHYDTTYYVTFEFSNGERMELHVSGSEYGQLAEGDAGELQFQGTRFISFEREV